MTFDLINQERPPKSMVSTGGSKEITAAYASTTSEILPRLTKAS